LAGASGTVGERKGAGGERSLLSVACFLLKKKLGFKTLMKGISRDASLVKGSHGRIPENPLDWPVLMAPSSAALPPQVASTNVYGQIAKGF